MTTLPEAIRFTFKRHQRLKSRKTIDLLFVQNRSFKLHPVKLVYIIQQSAKFEAQVTFVTSKKNFRNAVDRNRIKRMMREAYRLNLPAFERQLNGLPMKVAFMFIYQANTETPYRELETRIKQLLYRLAEKVVKEQSNIVL